MEEKYYVITKGGEAFRSDTIEIFYQKPTSLGPPGGGWLREFGIVVREKNHPVIYVQPSQTTAALYYTMYDLQYGNLHPRYIKKYLEQKGIRGVCDVCGKEARLVKQLKDDKWACYECAPETEGAPYVLDPE